MNKDKYLKKADVEQLFDDMEAVVKNMIKGSNTLEKRKPLEHIQTLIPFYKLSLNQLTPYELEAE